MKLLKNKLFTIEKVIFYLLIAFLPSQLGYHFWPDYSFIFGIRVDYLSPTIFFTDILFFILFSFFVFRQKVNGLEILKKYKVYVFLFLIFAVLNSLKSVAPLGALYKWLKIVEMLLLGFYVSKNLALVKDKIFVRVLSLSLIVISLLGISQFLLGKTLGGISYFIGERTFNSSTPGIALQTINGHDYLRAYSSFSHPNSFAGYLLIGILLFLLVRPKRNILTDASVLFSVIAFALTFSLAAFMASTAAFVIFVLLRDRVLNYSKALIGGLFLFSFAMAFVPQYLIHGNYFNRPEVSERVELVTISKKMFLQSPIIGKGLNTFVINLPSVKPDNSYFWFLQPVHNILWLLLSETGIVGIYLFLYFIFRLNETFIVNKNKIGFIMLFVILFIGTFDHYFLSLQQNMLSISVALAAAFSLKKA